ncbi:MAG TPA: bifunctional demethylmenaquinone methyltransferase/2-methoxy-6-polyprenyl-1,4-benzoquinol methylase UbiE [Saprospiraceae bacterium]|nr:bifunctional demethylmenaquinone methyltransferase/2-methoxy-6-polyprenyl-1,4-benzoquinol methylase UbiE [Saprospiraceae bacterium]
MNHDTIKPYDVAGEKKAQVTSMFDKIAPYYDFLNRLLTLRIDVLWRNKAIAKIRGYNTDTILDVATGTADLAISMSEKLDCKQVIGLDISANMLSIGNKKIDNKQLNNKVQLVLGDSENLPYDNETFTITTSSFGVRNFENLQKGLAEMYRVTQEKGHIMILEFSRPRVFPIKNLFNIYFKYILPVIGKITSKDPRAYQYLYESVQAFPDYERFVGILHEVGYKNGKYYPLTFGICTIYIAEK